MEESERERVRRSEREEEDKSERGRAGKVIIYVWVGGWWVGVSIHPSTRSLINMIYIINNTRYTLYTLCRSPGAPAPRNYKGGPRPPIYIYIILYITYKI